MQGRTATRRHGVTGKRSTKRLKHTGNLILDSKPLRSKGKGKHSIGREFQSLAIRGKKLLTQTSLQHQGLMTEKSCNPSEQKVDLLRE